MRSELYSAHDITLVISVRAGRSNPWVLPRLCMLAGYYAPAPAVVIADLGSEGSKRQELEQRCVERGFTYVRVEDSELYSAAVGRNRGAEAALTDLLFFADIDCIGESDLFARLAKHANDIRLARCFDQLVVLPAYHLTGDATDAVAHAEPRARADLVSRAMAEAVFGPRDGVVEYVDPFSNFLMCRRDFFSFIGGYNERFRGHGSEDFEFLLRCAAEIRQLPIPKQPARDYFSPVRNGFFAARKPYRGFRRLGELMAYPSETAGLRIAHLHHERSPSADAWYANRDGRRVRLRREAGPYLEEEGAALSYDWLTRNKRALVVLGPGRGPSDLVLPMRLWGYRLTPWIPGRSGSLTQLRAILESYDELIIVEPGLPDHALPRMVQQQLLAASASWVISAGLRQGEFKFCRYFRSELLFEGAALFEPYTSPVADGMGQAGWLFKTLPFCSETAQRVAAVRSFSLGSYASGKLQLALCHGDIEAKSGRMPNRDITHGGHLFMRRARKALRNPTRFLLDSRFTVLRLLGAIMFALASRGEAGGLKSRIAKRLAE